jgi:hypothetical protein
LTVLFGTVEYFEKEIQNFLNNKKIGDLSEESILEIYSLLEDELQDKFVCTENIRKECMQNLSLANMNLLKKNSIFLNKRGAV